MARHFTLLAAALTLLVIASAQAADQDAPSRALPVAKVRFEQNATDGDVEVVFNVTGRAAGLASLVVTAPDGRTVINFTAPDRSTLGMRQFVLESPEPKDVGSLKAAYPEGEYAYRGTTAAGEILEGKATLSHELPATSAFVVPQADARDVPVDRLEIQWAPVKGRPRISWKSNRTSWMSTSRPSYLIRRKALRCRRVSYVRAWNISLASARFRRQAISRTSRCISRPPPEVRHWLEDVTESMNSWRIDRSVDISRQPNGRPPAARTD